MNLRKLTRKSILGFGKNAELKVGDILKLDREYMIWVYYNCSQIDLFEDILDELGITEKFRIEKPGKDGDFWKANIKEILNIRALSDQEFGMRKKLHYWRKKDRKTQSEKFYTNLESAGNDLRRNKGNIGNAGNINTK